MAKRFIDTGLFKKKWFRELSPPMKTVWLYLFTNCDHAGIIDADYGLLSFMIGQEITDIGDLNGNVIEVEDKWYLTKFNEFQYGELNPDNRVHQSVINRLNKFNLLVDQDESKCNDESKNKPLISPLQRAKDKDKDKDKNKDKHSNFMEFWNLYDKKINKSKCKKKWNNLNLDDQKIIIKKLPAYIKNTPDKTFRKHPLTYLNSRGWEDEVIIVKKKQIFRKTGLGSLLAYCSKCGLKLFPTNEYQTKQSSSCCSADLLADDPNNDPEWVKNKIKDSLSEKL